MLGMVFTIQIYLQNENFKSLGESVQAIQAREH